MYVNICTCPQWQPTLYIISMLVREQQPLVDPIFTHLNFAMPTRTKLTVTH